MDVGISFVLFRTENGNLDSFKYVNCKKKNQEPYFRLKTVEIKKLFCVSGKKI